MKGKRIASSTLAAIMLASTTSLAAFAEMPDNSVVIGSKAFAYEYVTEAANRGEIIDALVENGNGAFIKFNGEWYTNDKTPVDTADIPEVVFKTAEGEEVTYEAADGEAKDDSEFKVVEVSGAGAKKIKVQFNKAVEESKVSFEVRKGTSRRSIKATSFSEDKKTVTIELTSKLADADYSVKVMGLADEALVGTAKLEAAKVSKIEVGSELAKLAYKKVDVLKVPVAVYNQYDEAVSEDLKVTVLGAATGSYSKADGEVTITATGTNAKFKEGDSITITLLHDKTLEFEKVDLEIAAAPRIDEIEFVGMYSAKDKKQLETTISEKQAGDVYVLFNALDQYGEKITDKNMFGESEIIIRENGDRVDLVNLGTESAKRYVDYIDTEDENTNADTLGVKVSIAKVGPGTMTAMSTANGSFETFDFEVVKGTYVDEFSYELPEVIAVGDGEIEVEFEALDQNGEAVTDVDILNKQVDGKPVVTIDKDAHVLIPVDGKWFHKDAISGKITLKAAVKATEAKEYYVYSQSSADNGSYSKLEVQKKAVIADIVGVKDLSAKALVNGEVTIKHKNIKVVDQYDREMTFADFTNSLTVTSSKTDIATKTTTDDSFTVKAIKKGESNIELKTVVDNDDVTYNFNFDVIDVKDVESYKLAETDLIFHDGGEAAIKVTADVKDGGEVVVPASYFKVIESDDNVEYKAVDGVLASTTTAAENFDKELRTVKFVVQVEGENIKILNGELKISNATPKVDKLALDKDLSLTTDKMAAKDGVLYIQQDQLAKFTDLKSNTALVGKMVKATDQYGAEITESISSIAVGGYDNDATTVDATAKVTVITDNFKTIQFTVQIVTNK